MATKANLVASLYKNNTTISLLRFPGLEYSKIIPKPISDDVYFLRKFEYIPITYYFGGKMFFPGVNN